MTDLLCPLTHKRLCSIPQPQMTLADVKQYLAHVFGNEVAAQSRCRSRDTDWIVDVPVGLKIVERN